MPASVNRAHRRPFSSFLVQYSTNSLWTSSSCPAQSVSLLMLLLRCTYAVQQGSGRTPIDSALGAAAAAAAHFLLLLFAHNLISTRDATVCRSEKRKSNCHVVARSLPFPSPLFSSSPGAPSYRICICTSKTKYKMSIPPPPPPVHQQQQQQQQKFSERRENKE